MNRYTKMAIGIILFGSLCALWVGFEQAGVQSGPNPNRNHTDARLGFDSNSKKNQDPKQNKLRGDETRQTMADKLRTLAQLIDELEPLLTKTMSTVEEAKLRENLLIKITLLDSRQGLDLLTKVNCANTVGVVLRETLDSISIDQIEEWSAALATRNTELNDQKLFCLFEAFGKLDLRNEDQAAFISNFVQTADREHLLASFFRAFADRDFEGAMTLAKSPEFTASRDAALGSIVHGMTLNNQFEKAIEMIESGVVAGDRKFKLLEYLISRATGFSDIASALRAVEIMKSDGQNSRGNNAFVKVLLQARNTEVLLNFIEKSGTNVMNEALKEPRLIRDFAFENPELALKVLSGVTLESAMAEGYSAVLLALLKTGTPGAEDLLTGLIGSDSGKMVYARTLGLLVVDASEMADGIYERIPAHARDEVTNGLIGHILSHQTVEAAREWLPRIEDPKVRSEAEGRIWARERDELRQNASGDPMGTVASIISGDSKYDTYWIEEAMMTWISNEPEKAETWYQENWKTLPPEKAQYVAAAYAKDALAKGDPATATQWANLIQDQKTKNRIVASIEMAGATQGQ